MRIKMLCLTFLLFAVAHIAAAQGLLDLSQFKRANLEFPLTKQSRITQPVAAIGIIDARPDTACLGFMKNGPYRRFSKKPLNDFSCLVFNQEMADAFSEAILGNNGKSSTGYRILVAIRELWMYENAAFSAGHLPRDLSGTASGLLFRADIYLERDASYIPLFQVDSIYTCNKVLKYARLPLAESMLAHISEKLNNCKLQELFTRASKLRSRPAVDSFYQLKTSLPKSLFLDTTRHLVFKTFHDFKTGNFASTRLRMVSDYLGDYLYETNATGAETLLHIYAFYAGGKLFINSNNSYSQVFIRNDRIYTIGCRLTVDRTTHIPAALPVGTTATSLTVALGGIAISDNSRRVFQPMFIDLVTGNIY